MENWQFLAFHGSATSGQSCSNSPFGLTDYPAKVNILGWPHTAGPHWQERMIGAELHMHVDRNTESGAVAKVGTATPRLESGQSPRACSFGAADFNFVPDRFLCWCNYKPWKMLTREVVTCRYMKVMCKASDSD